MCSAPKPRFHRRYRPVAGIGLYRDVWIAAIASSTTSLATRTAAICVRFQGQRVRRVYVTIKITFLTRKSALIGLRQRVASLTLNCNGDFAIRAYYEHSLSSLSAIYLTKWLRRSYVSIMSITKRYYIAAAILRKAAPRFCWRSQ